MKKLRVRVPVALLAIATGIGLCQNPRTFCLLPVPLQHQLEPNWCWVASEQMVMNFLTPGASFSQCILVGNAEAKNCCPNPLPDGCDVDGVPNYDDQFDFDLQTSPLTWSQVKNQIHNKGKPFVYGSKPIGNGVGHILVVVGYATANGEKYLLLNDPLPVKAADPANAANNLILTFDEYKNGNASYHHWF